MRIGIDASRIMLAGRTGTERYSYELIAALGRSDRHTNYTLYCNALPEALPPLPPTFALRRIPAPRLWTHTRLALEMRQNPPDVLFVPAHVVPLRHPPATVVTIHDLGYLAFPEAHTRARRLELHLTTLWSARAASHVIAISQATKNDLVRQYGIAPEKISVVHHGVSSMFKPVDDRQVCIMAQERYSIGHGSSGEPVPYLLYVGTVQPRKNLGRLIDAFAQAVRATGDPPLQLVIAGKSGWLTQSIEQRAAAAGVAERVCFTGYVDDADLPTLLSGALAFVFPSLYEGFGMPVLEAMACGTPVLTSTTSSLPEVAGDAALLIDPHDTSAIAQAIARLLSDSALREHLRARGLQHAATFTWERCAVATRRVLS
jgi:glycosyltransferase involved in cell wall biosynthesis